MRTGIIGSSVETKLKAGSELEIESASAKLEFNME
jgi:hypothetical protein